MSVYAMFGCVASSRKFFTIIVVNILSFFFPRHTIPMEENDSLLQAVLLAEFDIDAGASFRSIYPNISLVLSEPCSSSEFSSPTLVAAAGGSSFRDSVANLMLPDGAEKWEVSSTIFLLNQENVHQTLASFHRFSSYTFVQQNESAFEWVPLRASGVKLPELLQINDRDLKISLEYHGKTLLGPWLASEFVIEFPEEIPPSVVTVISSLQEELRNKEVVSGSPSGSGVGGNKEGEGRIPNEIRESGNFAFFKIVGNGSNPSVGFVLSNVDLGRFLQVHRQMQELARTSSPPLSLTPKNVLHDLMNAHTEESKVSNDARRESLSKAVSAGGKPLFAVTAVVSQKDCTARRGGVTKAVAAVGSSLVWLQSIFPLLVHCAYCCCGSKGTKEEVEEAQREFLKEVYESLHPLAINFMERYAEWRDTRLSLDTLVQAYSTSSGASSLYQKCVSYSVMALSCTFSLVVPISPHLDNVVLPDYNFERLLLTFDVDFIQLILGILAGKRIIVLSREHSAFEVCQVVIALGIIGTILDSDFLHTKVFPYVSINETKFSEVPGYVIGSMNPIFENAKVWGWDLLCDLDAEVVRSNGTSDDMMGNSPTSSFAGGYNRKNTSSFPAATVASSTMANIASAVGIANAIASGTHGGDAGQEKTSLPSHAARLYTQLIGSIAHMQAIRLPLSERCLRIKLQIEEYCHILALMGFYEGIPHLSIPIKVLSSYFFTGSGRHLIAQSHLAGMTSHIHTAVLASTNEPPDLILWCAALRRCGGMTMKNDPHEVQLILETLLHMLKTEEDVLIFLRRMPLALGGLNPVAMQLTHPHFSVRKSAMLLLRRIESSSFGKKTLASLNHFLMLLYDRFSKANIS